MLGLGKLFNTVTMGAMALALGASFASSPSAAADKGICWYCYAYTVIRSLDY